nr:hypothetical protein [Lysinibacillus timonensis]
MFRSFLKFWIPWVSGLIIAISLMSIWKREELDWNHAVAMGIACLAGGLILMGLKKVGIRGKN